MLGPSGALQLVRSSSKMRRTHLCPLRGLMTKCDVTLFEHTHGLAPLLGPQLPPPRRSTAVLEEFQRGPRRAAPSRRNLGVWARGEGGQGTRARGTGSTGMKKRKHACSTLSSSSCRREGPPGAGIIERHDRSSWALGACAEAPHVPGWSLRPEQVAWISLARVGPCDSLASRTSVPGWDHRREPGGEGRADIPAVVVPG